jgi:hypothetical protein
VYADVGHKLRDQLDRALPGTEVILDLWPLLDDPDDPDDPADP